MAAIEPFPEGSRILHIGPPKTGTTALQAACWHALDALAAQGVHYAGGQRHNSRPAQAVTGAPSISLDRREVPSMSWWHALVREMDRSGMPRVLYSSEHLAGADDDAIRRIARDVGPSTHVLVTLRSVDAILVSTWQQRVQAGLELTLDEWLGRTLDPARQRGNARTWRSMRQGELVDRWAAAVGQDRVTVIVLDRANPQHLFRAAESLMALPTGTLEPVDDLANRSLSAPEVEVVRRMNALAREAGISAGARSHLVLGGATANAKRRRVPPGTPMVELPGWAVERAIEIGLENRARLDGSGVRVIGDPSLLIPEKRMRDDDDDEVSPQDLRVDPETAATIAMGVAWGMGFQLGPGQPGGTPDLAMVFVPTRRLARQVARRGVARMRRLVTPRGSGDE
jgi:hypothetical protein